MDILPHFHLCREFCYSPLIRFSSNHLPRKSSIPLYRVGEFFFPLEQKENPEWWYGSDYVQFADSCSTRETFCLLYVFVLITFGSGDDSYNDFKTSQIPIILIVQHFKSWPVQSQHQVEICGSLGLHKFYSAYITRFVLYIKRFCRRRDNLILFF